MPTKLRVKAAAEVRFQLLTAGGAHVVWLILSAGEFGEAGTAPRLICWRGRYFIRMSRLSAILGGDQYREAEVYDVSKTTSAE